MRVITGFLLTLMFLLLIPGGLVLASTPTPPPLPTITPPPNCGTVFAPCGPLPFQLISFPTLALPSPTLITVSGFVPLSTVTPGGPSLTPSPTATLIATMDVSGISTLVNGADGISATLFAQTTQTILIDGTPSGAMDMGHQLGSKAGTFFAAAKALELTNLNQAGGIISFLFLVLGFVLLVQVFTIVIPIFMKLIQLLLQVITAIKFW